MFGLSAFQLQQKIPKLKIKEPLSVSDTGLEIELDFTLVYQGQHIIKLSTVNYFSLVTSHWLAAADVQFDFNWAEEEIWSLFPNRGKRTTL